MDTVMNFQYYTNSWAESRFSQATISPVSTNQNPLKSKVCKRLPHPRQRVKQNSRLLPQQAVDIMITWYERNYTNPYPEYRDLELMAKSGSITIPQVKQWFVNIRRRTANEFRKTRVIRNYKADNFMQIEQVFEESEKSNIDLYESNYSSNITPYSSNFFGNYSSHSPTFSSNQFQNSFCSISSSTTSPDLSYSTTTSYSPGINFYSNYAANLNTPCQSVNFYSNY